MKRGGIIALGLVLVAALGAGVFYKKQANSQATSGKLENSKAGKAASPAPATPSTVEISSVELYKLEPTDLSRQVPITGSLRASNQTMVKSKVAGELVELLVREGMSVKAGAVVARIDNAEFELRVKEREAQLRGAEAQLEQAKRTLDNNKQLLEKNFISQSVYDNAKSAFDVAIANIDAIKAQLAQAKKASADTKVIAPMSGTVAERFAQPGEKVSPDNRIISIVDLSRMELEAAIPSSDVAGIRIGQSVTLDIEGIQGQVTGKVVRISPSTQSGTRSVPIYIALENKDSRARAGLFAQGNLALDKRSGVLVVPVNAVRENAGRVFVYGLEADKLVEKEVKLGARDETRKASNGSEGVVEVISGLKANDQIIGVNLGTLRAGTLVKLGK